MNPSICAEIIDVEVEAEYRGSVYEQTVSIKTETGIIDCFEGKNHVTNEDCGDVVDLVLLARHTDKIEISDKLNFGIDQPDDQVEGRSSWHCTLQGEILNTDVSDRWLNKKQAPLLLVEINHGIVLVASTPQICELVEDDSIKPGTEIIIDCSRIDIVGRN